MIGHVLVYGFVGGTDDLSVVGKFLHTVRAPASDTCHRKDRRKEFLGQVQALVNKAGIEVHIAAYALVDLALFGNDLGT